MYLDVFDRNPYGTNCWLLGAEGSREVVVVDPGFDPGAVQGIGALAGRSAVAVLLTHAHGDHAAAAGTFARGIPVYVHPADAVAFSDPEAWAAGFANPLDDVEDLRTFDDGDRLSLAALSIEVVHTPGHTPGSVCLLVDDDVVICSGDLVFAGSIGRSDFSNSDPAAMEASLTRFMRLPDDLDVLPGHGPTTTVGRERASNPFLVGIA